MIRSAPLPPSILLYCILFLFLFLLNVFQFSFSLLEAGNFQNKKKKKKNKKNYNYFLFGNKTVESHLLITLIVVQSEIVGLYCRKIFSLSKALKLLGLDLL